MLKALKYIQIRRKKKLFELYYQYFSFCDRNLALCNQVPIKSQKGKKYQNQKKMSVTQNILMILRFVRFVGVQEPTQQCDEELAFVTWHESAHQTAATLTIQCKYACGDL